MVAQRERTRLVFMRTQVGSLVLLSGLRVRCCHELQCRLQMWLWLWCSPVAAAPIHLLAWELPYAAGMPPPTKDELGSYCTAQGNCVSSLWLEHDGERMRKRIYIYTHTHTYIHTWMTRSLHCTTETEDTVQIKYTLVTKKSIRWRLC